MMNIWFNNNLIC